MNKGKLKVTNLPIRIIVVKKFQRNIYNFDIEIQRKTNYKRDPRFSSQFK